MFGPRLSQPQVTGIEAILDACFRYGVDDPHHVCYILANVYRETGGYMFPIKETVYASHKDKNPSDKTVIARLNKAYVAGKLPWVKNPYWENGWFGRGQLQITHKSNYEKMGKRLDVDLVSHPEKALDPNISADIAVVGMSEGLFTGKKLSDYKFPDDVENPPAENPRRIVNGKDGTDEQVAGYYRTFYAAMKYAGVGKEILEVAPTPEYSRDVVRSVQQLLRDKGYPEVGEVDGLMGERTRNVIMVFEANNGLPIKGEISDELLAHLVKAPPRLMSPKRANATEKDLMSSKSVKQGNWLKKIGIAVLTTSGIGGLMDGSGDLQEVVTGVNKLNALFGALGSLSPWIIGIAAGGAAIYFGGNFIREQVQAYREGRHV